ncbi:MAG: hypothetical protein WAK31_05540 [Chthoniobacterales bacterium]
MTPTKNAAPPLIAAVKAKVIQEYYRQMRKFGCNILVVVQQYDIIKDSAVRGAMIGNSKMFIELKSQRPQRLSV